jgi:hypothetical protein
MYGFFVIHLTCILISFFLATWSKTVQLYTTFSICFSDILHGKQMWNFRRCHLWDGCHFSVCGIFAVSISFGIWNTVTFWNKNLTCRRHT